MQITDLSYLEILPEANSISGSAGVFVSGEAAAFGDSAYSLVTTDTTFKTTPSGVSQAKGQVTAIAIGDSVDAGVFLYGEGDNVKEKTKVKYFDNKDMLVVRGFIRAKSKS